MYVRGRGRTRRGRRLTEAGTITAAPAPPAPTAHAVRAGTQGAPRYWAFLSYSHDDKTWADWLHHALETYRVPRKLVGRDTGAGPLPARLTPIFRDRDELPAATDLGDKIEAALAASRFLVVLCSPTAATSRWANEEVLTFKRMHPDRPILAMIVDGEPGATDLPGREAEECFPPALRYELDAAGELSDERAEPIAADAREEGDGRKMALTKLVAGMLGVGLDELVEREAQRRQKRLAIITAASMAGMVVTSGLAVVALQARDEAREQRAEAEGLIGFMLGDLRGKLEPLGKLDVLDSVGERALRYYSGQDKKALSEEGLAQRSKALTLIGEIAQRRGDLDGALKRYSEALAGTAERLERAPDDPSRLFDHAQNVFWVGYIAWERRQIGEASRRFIEYKRLAERMIAIEPGNPRWQLEGVYADTNLGTLMLETKQYEPALTTLAGATRAAERLSAARPADQAYRTQVIDALAWQADAQEGAGRIAQALASRRRQVRLINALGSAGDTPDMQSKAAVAYKMIGRLEYLLGRIPIAIAELRHAAAIADGLRAVEPANAKWGSDSAGIYYQLGLILAETGDRQGAARAAWTSCALARQLVERDSSSVEARILHLGNCHFLRARGAANARSALREARAAIEIGENGSSGGRTDGRELRIKSLLVAGDQLAATNRTGDALANWSSALVILTAAGDSHPNMRALQFRLLRRLGRHEESEAAARQLEAMGYRTPVFVRERGRQDFNGRTA